MIQAPFDRGSLPHKPGVYIFKDKEGEILYVGKAIDLYSRVSSYFADYQEHPKTSALVEKIKSVETIVVESELEALVLEANLIKSHLPPFNIRLTDDKDYLYIKVTKADYPQIITARKKELSDALQYFGPFPSATTVKTTLKRLRRIFPWCQKTGVRGQGIGNSLKPCFYYHIGLCPGPCKGVISKEDYNQIIKNFIKFMQGKREELLKELNDEMTRLSEAQQFEQAQIVKRTISGVEYLLQPNKAQSYLENPNFLEDQNKKGLEELQKYLGLPKLPDRIECYDISNIQGINATGSIVVLTNGEIDKSQYRKFKIKISGKPNDYAMMAEMVGRRLKHDEWPLPDLMLIDGGRGQVRAAVNELRIKNYELRVPAYGLAKRMEWLYPPDGNPLKLPKSSLGLRLLQKIRDEAHRFAITYHKKLRAKEFLTK